MKKVINILISILMLMFVFFTNNIVGQAVDRKEAITQTIQTLYTNVEDESIKAHIIKALHTYLDNPNKDWVIAFEGKEEDVRYFINQFNNNYGYVADIRVRFGRLDGRTAAFFTDTQNVHENIDQYLRTIEKAKVMAASLKGNTKNQTIRNVIHHVQNNAIYEKDYRMTEDKEFSKFYYGFYDNQKIVCLGYSNAVYQLLQINGVKAKIHRVFVGELGHAINEVEFEEGWKFVDTTWKKESDTLFTGFTIMK